MFSLSIKLWCQRHCSRFCSSCGLHWTGVREILEVYSGFRGLSCFVVLVGSKNFRNGLCVFKAGKDKGLYTLMVSLTVFCQCRSYYDLQGQRVGMSAIIVARRSSSVLFFFTVTILCQQKSRMKGFIRAWSHTVWNVRHFQCEHRWSAWSCFLTISAGTEMSVIPVRCGAAKSSLFMWDLNFLLEPLCLEWLSLV